MAEHQTFSAAAVTTADSIPEVNSVFEQPWWLDSVVPGAWSEAVVRRGDEVVARLSFARRRKLGMTMIVQPSQRGVEIDHQLPLDALLRLDAGTYARKRLRRPHSYDVLRRLDAACAARGSRRILRAIDAQGRTHATLYLAWDERTVYALLSALDPALRVSGANTLLYSEAIRLASEVSRAFDFEGSMVEPIEHYFRAFGASQTPYFCISKVGPRARPALATRSARQALGRLARRRG